MVSFWNMQHNFRAKYSRLNLKKKPTLLTLPRTARATKSERSLWIHRFQGTLFHADGIILIVQGIFVSKIIREWSEKLLLTLPRTGQSEMCWWRDIPHDTHTAYHRSPGRSEAFETTFSPDHPGINSCSISPSPEGIEALHSRPYMWQVSVPRPLGPREYHTHLTKRPPRQISSLKWLHRHETKLVRRGFNLSFPPFIWHRCGVEIWPFTEIWQHHSYHNLAIYWLFNLILAIHIGIGFT